MANTLITQDVFVREAMEILNRNVSFVKAINREYDKDFVRDEKSGLAIKMISDYDVESSKTVQRMDVLFGTATLRPNLGVLLSDSEKVAAQYYEGSMKRAQGFNWYIDQNYETVRVSSDDPDPEPTFIDPVRMYGADERAEGFPAIITPKRRVSQRPGGDWVDLGVADESWMMRYRYSASRQAYFVPYTDPYWSRGQLPTVSLSDLTRAYLSE